MEKALRYYQFALDEARLAKEASRCADGLVALVRANRFVTTALDNVNSIGKKNTKGAENKRVIEEIQALNSELAREVYRFSHKCIR